MTVTCLAGTRIIGGSALDTPSVADVPLTVSRPLRTTPGAEGNLPTNGETFDAWPATSARAFAICAQT